MILEKKISSEILAKEDVLSPLRLKINNEMTLYGDTDFRELILKRAIYFCLDKAVYLSEDKRRDLYKLLKLNIK